MAASCSSRDALAVLDALGVDSAHVGGLVAQAIAIEAPLRGALADPVRHRDGDPSGADVARTELRWCARRAGGDRRRRAGAVGDPAGLDSAGARGLRAMLLGTAPEGYAAAAVAIAEADLSAGAATLTMPTLILVGHQDQATPIASAEALQHAIAGSELVVLGEAAHIPTVERAEDVTRAMQQFLDRHNG